MVYYKGCDPQFRENPLKIGGGGGSAGFGGKLKLKIDIMNRKVFKYAIKLK